MKFVYKNISPLTFFVIIFLANNCSGYKQLVAPKNQPISLEKKAIILHKKNCELYFYNVDIVENHIRGDLSTSIPEFVKDEQLHFYIDSTFTVPDSLVGKISIPVTAIKRVDVYDIDVGKTLAYNIAGIATAICVMVILILIDLKK